MSIDHIEWRPPIDHWYKVKAEAYKIIFEEAKVRLEDILTESESITNKSIKMLTSLAAFLGFFIGFIAEQKYKLGYISVFLIFFIADAVILFF